MFQEYTLTSEDAEFYVCLDVETGAVLDLYARPGELDAIGAVELPGLNPLFHHAQSPADALRLVEEVAEISTSDAADYNRLRAIAAAGVKYGPKCERCGNLLLAFEQRGTVCNACLAPALRESIYNDPSLLAGALGKHVRSVRRCGCSGCLSGSECIDPYGAGGV